MKNTQLIYLDYNKISLRLDAMVESLRKEEFTAIVVIVRGGLFTAQHLSVRIGLPIHYLRYNRQRENQISWIGEAPKPGKILLIEDLAGKGRTLLDCRDYLKSKSYQHKALVIWKDVLSASTPEYIAFETSDPQESFIVPWEKAIKINFEANHPDARIPLQDHNFELTGWDMDGIFLEDVPSEVYKVGLEQALCRRDEYDKAQIQPLLNPQDIIITGRPQIDTERTIDWLNKHQIYRPVFLRDDGIEHPSPFTTALWKGKKALELGCCRYVESDSRQAVHISANFPQLEVVWWNDGEPIILQASLLLTAI